MPGFVEATKLQQMVELITRGQVSLDQILGLTDPSHPYRQIEGLIVLGPAEWDKAVRGPKGENPLGLADNWCPQVPLPDNWTVDLMTRLAALCSDSKRDYQCTPVLRLALPEVAGIPTSLIGQCDLWAVAHDNLPAGKVREQMRSNYFVARPKDYPFAPVPAVTEPTWKVNFVDFPQFTTDKGWKHQQSVAQERGLVVSTVSSDALMMNLLAAALDKRFRTDTSARTADPCGGAPLVVYFDADGLYVNRNWNPGSAYPHVGAGLEGVPLELVA
ncbi:hypothetical protein KJ713_03840 [Patescibacteria group bacterium]|nr:hypothetical protein [Patescibacteria group bacterium]